MKFIFQLLRLSNWIYYYLSKWTGVINKVGKVLENGHLHIYTRIIYKRVGHVINAVIYVKSKQYIVV